MSLKKQPSGKEIIVWEYGISQLRQETNVRISRHYQDELRKRRLQH